MQRIIVDDGLRYIREGVQRDELYDVLLIDVSYNAVRPLMAPVEEFLLDDEIQQIYKIIRKNGAVIVNVLTLQKDINEADRVLFVYSRHFPSCYLWSSLNLIRCYSARKRRKIRGWTTGTNFTIDTL
ncbi:hypothetical protein KIN20_007296 [Parelaphostrongylus tenuis]|uniref:PABS domain-containing protein n=1 Tax=Parelaphostrongylus tenuis TaxID=148309 RepID=A0AAD5QLX4_PARTN|nr:hypothetical protein KIN20_007296 [Parelaphostrongylus tenuis]